MKLKEKNSTEKNINSKEKFLIIRLSSMGDVILTSALIRSIKNSFPDSEIDFVTDKAFFEVLKHNPHLNKIILYDKTKTIAENNLLKNELSADYKIIDLQNNIRSLNFRKGLGSEISQMEKRRFQKLFLIHFKKNLFEKVAIPELYIKTAEKFGVKNDEKGLEIWLENEKKLNNNYIPEVRFSNFIKQNRQKNRIFAVALGAKHKTKQWLPEYFAELIVMLFQKYEADFYLLGGKEDTEVCQKVAALVKSKVAINHLENIKIIDNSGKTSILETANLLNECDLLITNDTGVMHIGAARYLPIVAIFGSTSPILGFAPYYGKLIDTKLAEICELDLKCRPCTHIGKSKCPKKHFKCMKELTPELVFEKANSLINSLDLTN
jgi:heptosyltransferase-2